MKLWPFNRRHDHRSPVPSAAALDALREAESMSTRASGQAALMRDVAQQLRDHRGENHYSEAIAAAYLGRGYGPGPVH